MYQTINQAILEVFKRENNALRVREIYLRIQEDNLYEFNTSTPEQVVRTALRRHAEGLNFASSSEKKLYQVLDDGRYWLKGGEVGQTIEILADRNDTDIPSKNLKNSILEIESLQDKYANAFRDSILNRLKRFSPKDFEIFCRELLKVYGFEKVEVTKLSRDGGIDGFGELKIGLSYLHVSFQCKRWDKTVVRRPEIDKFRGASQGKFQQAIIFTTSTFTQDAKKADNQVGAIPIALFDGDAIVNLMIEKRFGVEVVKEIYLFEEAFDKIFDENNMIVT
ncbi:MULTISPECIES: restriction endonuclease [unclassified Sphingobacterium]|uniref:restriction endonuclease n=1 Tax=unclassified Sphingobacterium TaxID=2609468 RepID=UPI0025ED9902|nr:MULTISPECIES: restriction endonuclease [unclassified Sphingobacterium]